MENIAIACLKTLDIGFLATKEIAVQPVAIASPDAQKL